MKNAKHDSQRQQTVVGIGSGARCSAIAVNAHVLRSAGLMNIDLRLIECNAVGANWSGTAGYTDGAFPLDTSPLKDLTFPGTTGYGDAVDHELGHFTFVEFLKATGRFERWVSSGTPPVSHLVFSEYQAWAVKKAAVPITIARVERLKVVGGQVEVKAISSAGHELITVADGVVLSGPGEPNRISEQDDDADRVFDAKTYWMNRMIFKKMHSARVAVIGSGQSAGTIAKSLVVENPKLHIDVINRYGFLPVQSAGFHENYMCSSALADWQSIPIPERAEIMKRINNGVIDSSIKAHLDTSSNVNVVRGSVNSVCSRGQKVLLSIAGGSTREYDAVVVAIGFDPLATLRRLMPDDVKQDWFAALESDRHVDHHLRLPGLACNIHVPALAGLSQGPGLALLSCLATMAKRVLSAYLPTNVRCNDHYSEGAD